MKLKFGCVITLLLVSLMAVGKDELDLQLLINHKAINPARQIQLADSVDTINIGFRLSKDKSNMKLTGLHPAAWIRRKTASDPSCNQLIHNYLAKGKTAADDIPLNGFNFITLNEDNTIAVMNPRLDLATSNLVALTRLNSQVADWTLSANGKELYITLGDKQQLLVLNPLTGTEIARVALDSQPSAIAIFNQSPLLWVASEKAGLVYLIDVTKQAVLQKFSIGTGRVMLRSDLQQHRLFAYSSGDGKLVGIDTLKQQEVFRKNIQPGITGFDYSPQTKRIYMVHPEHAYLFSIDPETTPIVEIINLASPSLGIEVVPDRKWLLTYNGKQAVVNLVNLDNNQLAYILQFKHPFDHVVLSKQYAYIRHTDHANVSLVNLHSLKSSQQPVVIEVPFGINAPNTVVHNNPLLSPIATLPGKPRVIITNPADRTLFLFMEGGMKAPMNAFRTWTAAPIAVLVHNFDLYETQQGIYETTTRIKRAGHYEMLIYIPELSEARCLPFTVLHATDRLPVSENVSKRYKVTVKPDRTIAGLPVQLQIDIHTEEDAQSDARQLQILLFRPGSNWQQRIAEVKQTNGKYWINVIFPEAGKYKLVVNSESIQFDRHQGNIQTIVVVPSSP